MRSPHRRDGGITYLKHLLQDGAKVPQPGDQRFHVLSVSQNGGHVFSAQRQGIDTARTPESAYACRAGSARIVLIP